MCLCLAVCDILQPVSGQPREAGSFKHQSVQSMHKAVLDVSAADTVHEYTLDPGKTLNVVVSE